MDNLRSKYLERSFLYAFSAYTWYEAIEPFVLRTGTAAYTVQYGDEVGIRENQFGKARVVLRKLGPGKIFKTPHNTVAERLQLMSKLEQIEQDEVVKVSTPHTDVTVRFDFDRLVTLAVKNPDRLVRMAAAVYQWYDNNEKTKPEEWDLMGQFFKFFKLPNRTIWAYRGTKLSDHGRKVPLNPGMLVRLRTGKGNHVYQSWTHSVKTAEQFSSEKSYVLKTLLKSTQVAFAGPASFREVKTAVGKLENLDPSFLSPEGARWREVVFDKNYWKDILHEKHDTLTYLGKVLRKDKFNRNERRLIGLLIVERSLKEMLDGYYSYDAEQEIIVKLTSFPRGIKSEIVKVPTQ